MYRGSKCFLLENNGISCRFIVLIVFKMKNHGVDTKKYNNSSDRPSFFCFGALFLAYLSFSKMYRGSEFFLLENNGISCRFIVLIVFKMKNHWVDTKIYNNSSDHFTGVMTFN